MAAIEILEMDEGKPQRASDRPGLSTEGEVQLRQVLGPDRPIMLWKLDLAPGATVRWKDCPVGRIVYLWEGGMVANNHPMTEEGAVIIERRSDCEIKAGEAGCELVEFQPLQELSDLPGGHVHALTLAQAPYGEARSDKGPIGTSFFADSGCPTCELWLHHNTFPRQYRGKRHYHTQDEIILCSRGEMRFGTRVGVRGTVFSINRDAVYNFGAGEEELEVLNFRPANSQVVYLTKAGRNPPEDEQPMFRDLMENVPSDFAVNLGSPGHDVFR